MARKTYTEAVSYTHLDVYKRQAMAGTGRVTAEQFLTVFTVVIAFYFGTQAEKRARE